MVKTISSTASSRAASTGGKGMKSLPIPHHESEEEEEVIGEGAMNAALPFPNNDEETVLINGKMIKKSEVSKMLDDRDEKKRRAEEQRRQKARKNQALRVMLHKIGTRYVREPEEFLYLDNEERALLSKFAKDPKTTEA